MLDDEVLWGMTLEQLHLEYVGTQDAGGGDLSQDFYDQVMELFISGLPEREEPLTDAYGNPLSEGLQRGSDLWNSTYALMANSHPPEVAEEKTISCMIAMAGIFDKYLQERDDLEHDTIH